MGIAVFRKSTNQPIEWQEYARPGTCINNAVNAGLPLADLEERLMTLAQYLALMPQPPAPTKAERIDAEIAASPALSAIFDDLPGGRAAAIARAKARP